MRLTSRFFIAASAVLVAAASYAQQSNAEPAPAEILADAALFGDFSSLEVRFEMEIHERRGTKNRGLVAYVEQGEESYRALLQIVSPVFLNNLKFLTITEGKQRNQWMATSSGVRRVADSNRNDRLFDSDFTVEDLSDYDAEEYRLSRTADQLVSGSLCYVLDAVPISSSSDYSRKILYVEKETRLLARAEFFDDDGELVRQFELLERMSLNGEPFPKSAKMSTLSEGTHTILTVEEADADSDIPDRLFNRGSL